MLLGDDWLEIYSQSILDSKQEYLKQQNLGKNADPEKEKRWLYLLEMEEAVKKENE